MWSLISSWEIPMIDLVQVEDTDRSPRRYDLGLGTFIPHGDWRIGGCCSPPGRSIDGLLHKHGPETMWPAPPGQTPIVHGIPASAHLQLTISCETTHKTPPQQGVWRYLSARIHSFPSANTPLGG